MGGLDIRRAETRFHTQISWLDSWHSFSFGEHYNANNTHHGLLRVLNDDLVAAGGGFATHPHRDMEIVTWVLDGALAHRDSAGNEGIITRDVAQRMSAGSGIRHSEKNASESESVHLLQMWVPPDTLGIDPEYEQRDIGGDIKNDELFALASGRETDAAITLHQHDATLWIARLNPGSAITLPGAPFVDVFVARGGIRLGDDELDRGDVARIDDAGPLPVTAGTDGAELVVWTTYADLTLR